MLFITELALRYIRDEGGIGSIGGIWVGVVQRRIPMFVAACRASSIRDSSVLTMSPEMFKVRCCSPVFLDLVA